MNSSSVLTFGLFVFLLTFAYCNFSQSDNLSIYSNQLNEYNFIERLDFSLLQANQLNNYKMSMALIYFLYVRQH